MHLSKRPGLQTNCQGTPMEPHSSRARVPTLAADATVCPHFALRWGVGRQPRKGLVLLILTALGSLRWRGF